MLRQRAGSPTDLVPMICHWLWALSIALVANRNPRAPMR